MSLWERVFSKVHPVPTTTMSDEFELILASDVLARHVRRCDKAKSDPQIVPKFSTKQTRAKSACNRCAELKLKCNSGDPCTRCKSKFISCNYTRQGYSDPYTLYRVNREHSASALEDRSQDRPGEEPPASISGDSAARTPSITQSQNSAFRAEPTSTTSLPAVVQHEAPNNATESHYPTTDFSRFNNIEFSAEDATNIPDFDYFPAGPDLLSVFDFPYAQDSLLCHPETRTCNDFQTSLAFPPLGSDNEGKGNHF